MYSRTEIWRHRTCVWAINGWDAKPSASESLRRAAPGSARCRNERSSVTRVLQDIRCCPEGLRGRTRRLRRQWLHVAEHRLLQLRIHFVGDGHHVEQHGTEIDGPQIVLQSIEDADL